MEPTTGMIQEAIEIVSNVGFPIFITIFLLNRMETRLDHLVKALNELTRVIDKDLTR